MSRRINLPLLALCTLTLIAPVPAQQQQPSQQPPAAKPGSPSAKKTAKAAELDPLAEARRTTAILLLNSLADDARNFHDETLRARVQARAADSLWTTDKDRARTLFRRAWEAAEAADAENERRLEEEKRRQVKDRGNFSVQLPPSLRTEVLRLAAKRERALGEEFLARMDEAKKKEDDSVAATANEPQANNSSTRRNDPMETPPAIAKRLRLAIQLLEDGDMERAIQFADPALTIVSTPALEFLTWLRQRNAPAADERYALLLGRAASDPSSDPNTASLLSSYIFTPTLYVTFSSSGGSSSNSWGQDNPAPAGVSPQLRAAYFQTAANILLRPVPPPDQDRTSTGRVGWYMVIARLLPLFEQFAADKASALRTKLASLTPDTPERVRQPGNDSLTRGLSPEDATRDRLQETLNRLERAKTAEERDAIYVTAVLDAVRQKDSRVDELVDKIEDLDTRKRLRAYIDYEAAQRAIREKSVDEALRLARAGELTSIQRAWVLTEAARLLSRDEPGRASEILDEAFVEAKRIDAASPDRTRALVAIATRLYELDRVRVWDLMSEIVKASNAVAGEYTGEDGSLTARLQTKNMTMMSSNSAETFDLTGLFASLAREDLTRAADLARAFNNEGPRAVATLAVARAILDKKP